MSEDLDERERLLAHLELARGRFSLLMARYADEREAWRMWDEVSVELQGRGLTVALVDLDGAGPDDDLLGRLTTLAEGVDALFVVRLEGLLITPDAKLRRTRALATLNFNRDLLRERLGLPVVLWLSQRGARAFAQLAPDTFDVVRTTFELRQEPVAVPAPAEPTRDRKLRPRWRHAPAAERARLERRRQTLMSLLSDAEPENAVAGDLAASLASVALALAQAHEAKVWLERAAYYYTGAESFGAAATAHRQHAELFVSQGKLEEARGQLGLAIELVKRTDSVARGGVLRSDIVAVQALLDELDGRSAQDQASDLELFARWQDGDTQAGNILFTRHFSSIYRFFGGKVPTDARDDLLQETFLRVLKRKPEAQRFRTMLFQTARYVFNDYLRHHYRQDSWTPIATFEDDQLGDLDERTAKQDLIARQRLSVLSKAFGQLPIDTADLLELRYFQQLTLDELAQVFEVSTSTIKSRLYRGKRALRSAVEQELALVEPLDLDLELARMRVALEHSD